LQLIVLGFVTVTLLFSYPLMIYGFIFFTAYNFLEAKRIPLNAGVVFALCLLVWLVAKIFFISDYESGKISYPASQLGNTFKSNFGSIKNLQSLFGFLFTVYAEEMIMLVVVIMVLIFRRNYWKAILIAGSVTGF